jgi:mTERF
MTVKVYSGPLILPAHGNVGADVWPCKVVLCKICFAAPASDALPSPLHTSSLVVAGYWMEWPARSVGRLSSQASAITSTPKDAAHTITGATIAAVQDQKPGIAADHLRAADVLDRFGMSMKWVAWAFKRMPQLGALDPAELQARIDAVAAAFGGGLPDAKLQSLLYRVPSVLTMAAGSVAASHAWLVSLGLTRDEASHVLVAEPEILLASTKKLRNIAYQLCSHYNLSPKELRAIVMSMPRSVNPRFMAAGFKSAVLQQLEHVIANQRMQSS